MRQNLAAIPAVAVEPYIVSADIETLLRRWCERSGFVAPPSLFVRDIRTEFHGFMSGVFPGYAMIEEEDMRTAMADLAEKYNFPMVALDTLYCSSGLRLEVCRVTNESGEVTGMTNRAGAPSLLEQIKHIKASGLHEITLADDVIFSGKLVVDIIGHLKSHGLIVKNVCACIGIKEGIDKIAQIVEHVDCAYSYDAIIDEVCERDFYPGIPLSGRLLEGSDNVGMPYIYPFGDPVSWASIPVDKASAFSRLCLGLTTELFQEIERLSKRPVLYRNVPRKVYTLPESEGDTRFVELLQSVL
jgi:hypothetical protein